MVLSFDRNETTENARAQTHEFLRENLPDARAIVSIHRDKKEMTHSHVWIDCRTREVDRRGIEKKLQLDKAIYKTLDERWAGQYDRHYGTDYEREHKEKKTETRAWKRDRVSGIDRPKPARARDGMTADKYREKDLRDSGVNSHELNEKRIDRNKQFITAGQRTAANTYKQIDSGERESIRLEHKFSETLAASQQLQQTITRVDRTSERAAESANIDRELNR
jgi:predicted DNA-binding ribbon-helix-helix protein